MDLVIVFFQLFQTDLKLFDILLKQSFSFSAAIYKLNTFLFLYGIKLFSQLLECFDLDLSLRKTSSP